MTGIELIAKERQEQIIKHGRTVKYDSTENRDGELQIGARALLGGWNVCEFPRAWNLKICKRMYNKNRIEKLIIAGALIAAEIDRLNYKEE